MAIQACWELNDSNRKRELLGLGEAIRNFKINRGLILTYE
jgi:hypothetical protein